MDRCDCCGSALSEGIWVTVGRKEYKFCSSACLNKYEPELMM